MDRTESLLAAPPTGSPNAGDHAGRPLVAHARRGRARTGPAANSITVERLTFGISGHRHAARHHLQGLLAFALGLALTSGSLAALHATTGVPSRPVELTVQVGANLAATALRFALLRLAMHHRRG